MPFVDVLCPLGRVLLGCGQFHIGDAFRRGRFKQSFQKWPTPSASGSRAKTFVELRRPARFFDTNEVHHFAFGDVKAQTEFVVEFHDDLAC